MTYFELPPLVMSNTITLSVYETVGSPFGVSTEDGQRVYDLIAAALRADKKIEVSFLNIENLISAFLNAAIGQLYSEFSEEKIRANLSVSDLTSTGAALLRKVVENAKLYFSNPAFAAAQRAALEHEE